MFLCSVRMSKLKIFAIFAMILAAGITAIIVITNANSGSKPPESLPPEEMMAAETVQILAEKFIHLHERMHRIEGA